MKRIISILLITVLLVTLSACRKKSETAPEPEPASPSADEAQTQETEPVPPFPDDIPGSWILVDSNDTELTEELFPGAKELGGTMEISTDGSLSWTVGSSSGSGRILTAEGDDVSAELSRGKNGELVPVAGLLERSNEALALYLNFGGVDLIWVHVPPKTQS